MNILNTLLTCSNNQLLGFGYGFLGLSAMIFSMFLLQTKSREIAK
jgi:hypothetical protein